MLHKGSGTRVNETSKVLQLGSSGEAKSDDKSQEKVKMKPQMSPSVQSRVWHKPDCRHVGVTGEGSEGREASHMRSLQTAD